ncbi:MAG: cysteine synthase A [Clostridia bacterium]|nr:cysteine synthase A [Clostridia bacterium]
MKVYNNISELVGKTPILRLNNLEKKEKLCAKLFAKLEYFNPTGSVKDRAALYMLDDAENKGLIQKGATIIEPTSGNTGIGLAAIGVSRGYKVILTMPDSMSVERRKLLKAYGAEIVLTDGNKGMQGAVEKAKEIRDKTPNSFIAGQFDNPANPKAHYQTTAKEIYEDCEGDIDILVAGFGTGGTISGVGKYLKEKNKNIQIIAVEPESSPLVSKGTFGAHKIQGIGANFIPSNLDLTVIDKVLTITNEQAMATARAVAGTEGVLVGISSGAALGVAINLAKLPENLNKVIVAILPDTGERFLSTDLF